MIGIFGGTFDPVHLGHIKPALDVKRHLNLEELRFIPCSIPAHRDAPIATVEQRLAMLHLAVDEYADCSVDEREVNRQGVSYMVDTLQSLRQDLKDKSLCLIIGMDAFLGLNRWHHWQQLFELANFVVTYRPGFELEMEKIPVDLLKQVNQRQVKSVAAFSESQHGAIIFMPVTQLDISATDIRQRVKQQQSVKDQVPAAVDDFIQQQKLYTG